MTTAALAEQAAGTPLLRVEGIVKSFPGLVALDDVSLDVHSGEIVAVIGHNGSGKSTLVKVLAGIYKADAGSLSLVSNDEGTAEMHFIHQDLGLVPALTVIENLNLGNGRGSRALAPNRAGAERKHARRLLSRFGAEFDVNLPVAALTPAQRAIVAIARALDSWTHRRNILVLDEPTEALHASEVDVLMSAVRRVAADGAGVIFISHRLDEVLELADRVVVLRDGQKVADTPKEGLDHDRLVELVTGASLDAHTGRTGRSRSGAPALSIRALTGGALAEFDLDLYPGEVVGVAGVLGSGREDVPALIFGVADAEADTFLLGGRDYRDRSPGASIRAGLAYVAGDRKRYGAILPMTVRENITLPNLRSVRSRLGAVDTAREKAEAARLVADFGVRPARPEQTFGLFSGGNQQKVVLAKWLRNRPQVLLLEEPTQGVDIGAKAAIYDAVDQAAEDGAAVLVCSSDAKELTRLCDRVIVLREGRIGVELSGGELTEHRLVLEGYGLADAPAPEPLA